MATSSGGDPLAPGPPSGKRRASDEVEWNTIATREATRFILANPGHFVRMLPVKLAHVCGFAHVPYVVRRGDPPALVAGMVAASVLVATCLLVSFVQGAVALVRMVRTRTLSQGKALVPPLAFSKGTSPAATMHARSVETA